MKGSEVLRTAAGLCCVAGALVGVHVLRGRLNRRYDSARRVLDVAQIPRPVAARVASLGHTEWATDVLWINALLYYGESLYANLPARYIRQYAETMMELDPRFKRAYTWGATALLYRTVRSTEDDARRAATYLRRGIRHFPTDPELHLQLGFNLAYDQSPYKRRDSPEWVALRVEGGEHLRFAASASYGPTWLPLAASSLLMLGGRERDAILVLCDGLLHADDPALLDALESRLAELIRHRTTEDPLYRAATEFAEARRRSYPWMSPKLYVFVGEPVLAPPAAPPP